METTKSHPAQVLTVNAGSSSIKLALFAADNPTDKLSEATIDHIGQSSASLTTDSQTKSVVASDHKAATRILLEWLAMRSPTSHIAAVGHRIVHGGPAYYKPHLITHKLLADLHAFMAFDPEHMPIELYLIETIQKLLPAAQHIACFDTAFHHALPARAQLLPIPRRFAAEGVRRYGFHGLSYAFIAEELRRVEGDEAARGKVVIAHLGSGASLAALRNGASIDTTMSMTPTSGIPMSTRSGDLDPGLALYMARTHSFDVDAFTHMTTFASGLLGISETTGDMKQLLEIEAADERAKEAIDVFCYHVKKQIGALAAALGGLDTVVFTGGMGEQAPKIRERICTDLTFLGITLDASRNQQNARLISADGSNVGVHVIHTDEAVTIARETIKYIMSRTRGGHESNS
ncbi:MAG TPA: acetate/propionate family kinase [Candidatus Saccharimonadales bacterium]|jgi:acetate kinase|nr:acetate/propionate family kinase [Candidatus Saccharimonadales bacterium]